MAIASVHAVQRCVLLGTDERPGRLWSVNSIRIRRSSLFILPRSAKEGPTAPGSQGKSRTPGWHCIVGFEVRPGCWESKEELKRHIVIVDMYKLLPSKVSVLRVVCRVLLDPRANRKTRRLSWPIVARLKSATVPRVNGGKVGKN